ncbi:MAG: phosphoethanolamine--lipid A transferase [Pseudogulbenkiania sp.]|nr:phosphoethanolamine--lipid A transferase [Pseudogulbenkiania sp.]
MTLFHPLRAERMTLLLSLALIVFYNVPFWHEMGRITAGLGGHGPLLLAEAFVLLLAFFNLVLALLAWPYVFKPVMTALLLITALVSYFMNQYGIMIDMPMVQNVLQTDPAETRDLLTIKMGLFALGLGVLPALWLWKTPIAYRPPLRELGVRLVSLLVTLAVLLGVVFFAYQDFASLFRNNRQLRFIVTPSNYIQATNSYLHHVSGTGPVVVMPLGSDAKKAPSWTVHRRKTVLVVVVGETARADHFALNGYRRDTNPLLAKQAGLLNFSNVHSCGTETAVSVPCMFSGIGRDNYSGDAAAKRENLLDVLKHAGFDVLWRDNNSGCKGVCNRVAYEDLANLKAPGLCGDGECYDDVLLDGLAQRLQHLPRDSVIVLHQKGSHGPAYYKRYPKDFERFTPVCRTSELSQCSQQDIVNGFDNTLRYTDHMLSGLIDLLRANGEVNSGLIYLSDHGESLGENNVYLHGMPYLFAPEAQKHIPAVMWFSDGFRQETGLDTRCLAAKKDLPWSQDNLFHSVLGVLGVETRVYDGRLDLFQGCKAASKGLV